MLILCSVPCLRGQSDDEDLFEMSFEDLMKVKVVTAARVPEELSKIPASVMVMTRDEIEKYGFRSLEEIMQNIPGMFGVNDYSEPGLTFGVRGFWSGVANNNIIILVNGVHQAADFEANYPLKKITVPVEAIDRIELVRGPMSVVYGEGAFFGVLNIITAGGDGKPIRMASASVGSEKTVDAFLRLSGRHKDLKLRYTLNASVYDTEGLDVPFSSLTFQPSLIKPFIDPDRPFSTGGQLAKSRRYLNFNGEFGDFFLDLSFNSSTQENYFIVPAYSKGHWNRYFAANICLGFRRALTPAITLDGKLTFLQSRQDMKYDFFKKDFYGIQDIKTDTVEMEANAYWDVSPALNIKTGLSHRRVLNVTNAYDLPSFGSDTVINNYFFLDEGSDIITQAVYAQTTWQPWQWVEFIIGTRLEQMPEYIIGAQLKGGTPQATAFRRRYSENSIEFIPRLAALFKLNTGSIIKIMYGEALKRPSFFQNAQTDLISGHKALRPENIRTLEMNVLTSLTPSVTLSVNVFLNTLENLITRLVRFDDDKNYTTWSANAGKMVTRGVEVTLLSAITRELNLELSATLQHTRDRRAGYTGITTAYSPAVLCYARASWSMKKITLSITGRYVDGMSAYWDETLKNMRGNFGARIAPSVPGYLDMGANFRWENAFFHGVFINCSFSNILNNDIRYPTFTNNTWADRGALDSGRTFRVSIGCKF